LEYKQHNLKTGKVLTFSWVTDIPLKAHLLRSIHGLIRHIDGALFSVPVP